MLLMVHHFVSPLSCHTGTLRKSLQPRIHKGGPTPVSGLFLGGMNQMWNKNMGTNFLPSWINCIDESMSKWINKYMCPGFMYVPRKPWKFGNKYHGAGCADSNIIWALDLREGKGWPQNLGHKEFDNIGKTTGILLRLTKPV